MFFQHLWEFEFQIKSVFSDGPHSLAFGSLTYVFLRGTIPANN